MLHDLKQLNLKKILKHVVFVEQGRTKPRLLKETIKTNRGMHSTQRQTEHPGAR